MVNDVATIYETRP